MAFPFKTFNLEETDKQDYPLSFEKTKRKLGKEKSSADEIPKFSRNCGKDFNSSTDRKALSVFVKQKILAYRNCSRILNE